MLSTMEIVQVPLSQIKPYEKNPRKNKKGIAAVKQSIETFGFRSPILVNQEMVIICGHTRFEAAKELQLETVPAVIAADLTTKQEQGLRIADNRTAQESEWDKWKLRNELNVLFSDGEIFTGFSLDEISDLMSMNLGFRNQGVKNIELPKRIYPREIACDEEQDTVFDQVQKKMGKKKDVDVVMELCQMFLHLNKE